MKYKNKLLIFLSLLLMPYYVFAYSSHVILGGENIGIEVNSKGALVVGFYKVDDEYIGKNSGVQLGDRIIKVESESVSTIEEMAKLINKNIKNNKVNITVLRRDIEVPITLTLVKDNQGVYKTGLYVKDKITGIGTLTYIDPNTNIFGALGHEILESNTNIRFEISKGTIFKSDVIDIVKSDNNKTGEKNARFYKKEVFGDIKENEEEGIFGIYTDEYDKSKLIKVGKNDDIKLGEAKIVTVLEGNKTEEYSINIIKINKKSDTKNILFEITDEKLIDKTNGVVKGMSGSPIIQNDLIIGAVTHAIVNDNTKGYGIFITTMLEEGED